MNFKPVTAMPSRRRWAACSLDSDFVRTIGIGRLTNSRADGRCASRLPSCCCKSRTCCFWMSRRIISISKLANWLEEYLTVYPYAFVLISIDRYFLDVTVGKIVEIFELRIH